MVRSNYYAGAWHATHLAGELTTQSTVSQRQLKNHPKIVNMIEASVADLPGGVDGSKGYEIYILMEWCAGEKAPLCIDASRDEGC